MSVRPLSPELAAVAQTELNENVKNVRNDLKHIKDWLSKQKHLRAKSDDQWLIAFLRGCKFSLERTKEKIDCYYSVRNVAPDCFKIKYSDPAFDQILDTGSYLILPEVASPDSPRVIIIRPGSYDPDKFTITDIISVAGLIQQVLLLEDDHTVVAGTLMIFDLDSVKLAHYLQMTPMTMKKMVVLAQDAIPFRMKGVHCINTPLKFERIFNSMKTLLNEKNRGRIYVHNKNYEELYKYVPKTVLPAEYGGDVGTIREITDYWRKKIQDYSHIFEEGLQYGVDETKRTGKPRTAETMFGFDGSFRRLEVD